MPERLHGPTAVAVLLDVLDCAFDRRSWHGATLTGALRGLTPERAAARVAGRKCAWEQLLHAAYWKHRVVTALTGPHPFPRKGSDWPRLPVSLDAGAWRADLAMLRGEHRKLRDAVAALPPERLDRRTLWLVHGAAAHDLYHAGQIKLLRRMTGA